MATTAAQDRLRKPLAFTTNDVFGNTVLCAQSTWASHIETEHPEMAGRAAEVEQALNDPDAVRLSTSSPTALIHEAVTASREQIRVVTTYDDIALFQTGSTLAKVNTAFPVDVARYGQPNVGGTIYTRPAVAPAPAQPSNDEEEGQR